MLGVATFLLAYHQSALKIEDVKVGDGALAHVFDLVEVHYIGTLTSGKEFDSSVKKDKPFRFQLGIGQVIKGWDQGVLGMKVGGERNLVVPPDMAYGDREIGDLIPANSTLKFNVKLIKIIPSAKVEVVTAGAGPAMSMTDTLDCKVSIKLPDGSEIGNPKEISHLQFSIRSIAGLNQALVGIKAGEKRKVFIGYDLAFGEKGFPAVDSPDRKAGSLIPPKADLNLEIEALKIVPAKN